MAKGIGTWAVVVGAVLAIIVILIGIGIIFNWSSTVKAISTVYPCGEGGTMCYHENTDCTMGNMLPNAGSMRLGCPLDYGSKLSSFKTKEFTQCCYVKSCSDITGRNDVPRTEGCIEGALPRGQECPEDANNIDNPEKKCIGQAEDCKRADGCCCIFANGND